MGFRILTGGHKPSAHPPHSLMINVVKAFKKIFLYFDFEH